MKLKLALILIGFAGASLLFSDYKRDTRFETFINEYNGLTDEIMKELDTEMTSASVARAQKALDARRPDLKKMIAELKTVPNSRVSADVLTRFQKGIVTNREKIRRLFDRPGMKDATASDPQLLLKVKRLLDDYRTIIE